LQRRQIRREHLANARSRKAPAVGALVAFNTLHPKEFRGFLQIKMWIGRDFGGAALRQNVGILRSKKSVSIVRIAPGFLQKPASGVSTGWRLTAPGRNRDLSL
jgi:hypothetical protein